MKINYNKNINGIIYIICSSLCFAIMSSCVKFLLNDHSVEEIMFLRSILALCILSSMLRFQIFEIKKNYLKVHFLRSILGVSAMFLTFTALKEIPLSNITIINFSKIFFIIPLAIIFFKESINLSSILYILIGFTGVIIIIGIDLKSSANFFYYLFALAGTFLIALVKMLIKKISYFEKSLNIQFCFSFFSCLLLLAPYLNVAKPLELQSIFLIVLATIFGLLAQFFTIEGLRIGKSTVIMPFDFFRVIFASIIGFYFFSENITFFFLLGSLMILISGIKLMNAK